MKDLIINAHKSHFVIKFKEIQSSDINVSFPPLEDSKYSLQNESKMFYN